jgi:tRNA modification GTPase
MVEISCHASPYIQAEIMQALLESGCRLAGPGEFSMRAFADGKVDLSLPQRDDPADGTGYT